MDVDETKKRKMEEIPEQENIDLETTLKAYITANENMAKLVAVLAQKIVTFEKVFNKDLFKAS